MQWKSKPYALQADAEGMSGIAMAGVMVVDGLYFNSRVQRAPYWYTQLEEMSMEEASRRNRLEYDDNEDKEDNDSEEESNKESEEEINEESVTRRIANRQGG